jgi:predicted nucleic acid-binding protein
VGLIEDLGAGPVGLDSAIFIYFMEEHPRYLPVVEPVFQAIDEGRLEAVTSAVTLLETLVVPYRAGDSALADRYEALLRRSRGLRLIETDLPLLRAAALLRATIGGRTPDALQIASALSSGCKVVLTNDRRMRSPGGVTVLQLEEYLPEARPAE